MSGCNSERVLAPTQSFDYQGLPPEIRNEIARLALQTQHFIFISFRGCYKKRILVAQVQSRDTRRSNRGRKIMIPFANVCTPALLLVSKNMYQDGIGYLMENTFHFSCPEALYTFARYFHNVDNASRCFGQKLNSCPWEHLRRVKVDKLKLGSSNPSLTVLARASNLEEITIDFGNEVHQINLDFTDPLSFASELYTSLTAWLNRKSPEAFEKAVDTIIIKSGTKIPVPTTRHGSKYKETDQVFQLQIMIRNAIKAQGEQVRQDIQNFLKYGEPSEYDTSESEELETEESESEDEESEEEGAEEVGAEAPGSEDLSYQPSDSAPSEPALECNEESEEVVMSPDF